MSQRIERILVCGRIVHVCDEFTEAEQALMQSIVAGRQSELSDDVVITTVRGRVLPDPNSQTAIEGTVWGLQNKYDLRGLSFQTEFRELGGYSFLVVYFGEHLGTAEVISAGEADGPIKVATGRPDATVERDSATEIKRSDWGPGGSVPVDGSTAPCPFCGEPIQPSDAVCPFCGSWLAASPREAVAIDRQESPRFSCPSCKEFIAPGLRWCPLCHSHTNNPEFGRLASPSVRLGATLIDIGIPGGGLLLAVVLIGGSDQLLRATLLLGLLGYLLVSLALFAHGRTPGKALLDVTVITKRGMVAGLGVMILREIIGKSVSCWVLGLGFLWILFDSERQGWHDKVASTYVVANHV